MDTPEPLKAPALPPGYFFRVVSRVVTDDYHYEKRVKVTVQLRQRRKWWFSYRVDHGDAASTDTQSVLWMMRRLKNNLHASILEGAKLEDEFKDSKRFDGDYPPRTTL